MVNTPFHLDDACVHVDTMFNFDIFLFYSAIKPWCPSIPLNHRFQDLHLKSRDYLPGLQGSSHFFS